MGAVLPHRATVQEAGEDVRVFTREQLATFLRVVHPGHRLLFRLLAATGLRWSEVVALRWRDVQLDGSARVKIRRALTRGRYAPPKSSHGRRDVPLPHDLVHELRGTQADRVAR